jgi:hypothetical protein
MAPKNLLEYLHQVKANLSAEQQCYVDDFVIGILSLRVTEQVWKDAIDMGVRLATKRDQKNKAGV